MLAFVESQLGGAGKAIKDKAYLGRTGDIEFVSRLWPPIERALHGDGRSPENVAPIDLTNARRSHAHAAGAGYDAAVELVARRVDDLGLFPAAHGLERVPELVAGARFGLDNARDYDEAYASAYIRYLMTPQGRVSIPPAPARRSH